MWHEARRREKATQKLLNDHKRRAERRREENKVDASSLLQINGLKAKLHLDPAVYKQAAHSLVPWQGDKNITIDRFDVRATLSSIPSSDESSKNGQTSSAHAGSVKGTSVIDASETTTMTKLLNYERYRLLIQNDCNKTPEDLRLRLVAKSDVLSDAKMRKLKYNTFGTLGETSIQESSTFSQGHYARKASSSGFSYSSVPPPQALLLSSRGDIVDGEQHADTDRSSRVIPNIHDLCDYNLDGLSLRGIEDSRVQEISARFGLEAEELMLLAKNDDRDVDYKQTLSMLDELEYRRKSREKSSDLLTRSAKQFYGPALPPEMLASQQESSSPVDGDLNQDPSASVRQRSPSGGSIPMRQAAIHSPESPKHEILSSQHSARREVISGPENTRVTQVDKFSKQEIVDEVDGDNSSRRKEPVLESVLQKISQVTRQRCPTKEIESQHNNHLDGSPPPLAIAPALKAEHPPRRASTPLIYRKNCRSSRSLSRERGHYRSRRHHSSSRSLSSLSPPTSSSASRSARYSRRRRSRSMSFRTSSYSSICSPRLRRSRQRQRPPGRSKRRRRRRRNRRR